MKHNYIMRMYSWKDGQWNGCSCKELKTQL